MTLSGPPAAPPPSPPPPPPQPALGEPFFLALLEWAERWLKRAAVPLAALAAGMEVLQGRTQRKGTLA